MVYSIMSDLLRPTKLKKFLFFLAGDAVLLSLAFWLSFVMRFEFHFPYGYENLILTWLPVVLAIKILLLQVFHLYNISWSFVGIREMFSIFRACFFSSLILALINQVTIYTVKGMTLPRSVILIDFMISILFILAFRVSKRFYVEAMNIPTSGKRTLIIGAGPTGERLVREFIRSGDNEYYPVGYVDDDPNKVRTLIHGVQVLGNLSNLPEIVKDYSVEAAIIAITTAKHIMIQKLFSVLNKGGVKEIKVVPHLSQLPSNSVSIKDIQSIRISDLLYRDMVETDTDSIRDLLAQKRVLITGAAGSIGSEIVRQVLLYHPSQVIVFDIDETEVFNLMIEIKPKARMGTEIVPYVGDVRSDHTMKKLFKKYAPEVVFHAAAYKHVPMMEVFPSEALETNFMGTFNLARNAVSNKVKIFVNISTDKAVNPTSIMGATKRMAEMVCSTFNQMNGTNFISVRFGNVLGSRGSVVPIFLNQIKKGGPITVTHKQVKRYFMTIPEAVSLVFQAASMGRGGEVFVLDMGEPVFITKLAEDLIKLNGMEPYTDIPIEFVGLRPGEKLFEELLTAEEGTDSTNHEKIFIAKNATKFDEGGLEEVIAGIQRMMFNGDFDVKSFLKQYVPFYQEKK